MSEIDSDEQPQAATRLVVYAPTRIMTGTFILKTSVRLSDLLNNWSEDFFPLQDPRTVDLRDWAGEPVPEMGPLLICREEILLLHEIPTRSAEEKVESAREMRVPKLPTRIRAYIGPFRVEGNVHLPRYSDLATYLNRATEAFVPLTDAVIYPPTREQRGIVRTTFVLVRRNRLIISGLEDTGFAEPAG